MDNSLLKILLATLLARQDLQSPPTIENSLRDDMVFELNWLNKQPNPDNEDSNGLQAKLAELFHSNPEWQQQYEIWLKALKNMEITSDWLPTKEEFEEVIPPETLSVEGLILSDSHSSEIENEALPLASKSAIEILNGNKQPEELAWLQRVRKKFISFVKGGFHIGE